MEMCLTGVFSRGQTFSVALLPCIDSIKERLLLYEDTDWDLEMRNKILWGIRAYFPSSYH